MKRTLAMCAVLLASAGALLASKPATPSGKAPSTTAKVTAAAPKSVDGARPSPEGTFTGDYRDGRIRDVLFDIARAGHLNLVMPAEVTGSITAHFEKMPIPKALDFVAGLAGADYRIDEGTVFLTRRSPAPPPPNAEPPRVDNIERQVVQRRVVQEDDFELYRMPPSGKRQEPVRVETRVIIQNKTVETPRYKRYDEYPFGGRRIEIHPGFYITTWPTQVYHTPFGPYW